MWERLWDEVRREDIREPVAFGLVSHADVSGRTLVLVQDLVVPPEEAFVPSPLHGAKWTGAYNIALLNRALERGLGIVIFHYHRGGGSVAMSGDDLSSARRLLPAFQMVAPDRPHGSVVFGENSSAGLLLLPESSLLIENFTVRFFTDTVRTLPLPPASAGDLLLLRRQPLVDSSLVRALLRQTTVCVVGLSGGGTQVVRQLSAFDFGEIIGIDRQRITPDNLLATAEFGWADALLQRRKASVVKSKVRRTNRKVRFTPIKALVPEKAALEAVKRADILVGCVNNLHARADLQEIAWRYCIPYIDIGLGLFPFDRDDEFSEIAAISGNVSVCVPGGPCLWCSGFISEDKLRAEANGGDRSYLRIALKSRSGKKRPAYVANFNGVLAGLAAADVIQLTLGYSPTLTIRKQYDALTGTVTEVMIARSSDCPKCSTVLAAGDPIWR